MTEPGGVSAHEVVFGAADVEVEREEILFDGFWTLKRLTLRHRRYAGGWSDPMTREVHCRGEAVGVLLYDPDLDVVGLVEQFRVGPWAKGDARPWLLELVAGLREEGEDPEGVAIRETREEAGCEVQSLRHIASYYSSPGGCDEYFHLYCAKVSLAGVRLLHGQEHEHEDIRLHVVQVSELPALIAAGRCNNAHSLLALQWFEAKYAELRAP
jgi:ADP-ribose pyrophosphatase